MDGSCTSGSRGHGKKRYANNPAGDLTLRKFVTLVGGKHSLAAL